MFVERYTIVTLCLARKSGVRLHDNTFFGWTGPIRWSGSAYGFLFGIDWRDLECEVWREHGLECCTRDDLKWTREIIADEIMYENTSER